MQKKSIENKILVILGPTSSGKSDIAIKLAKKFDGEIISADSRQIFRGMDIGTGKIEGKVIGLSLREAKRRSNPEQYKKTQDCFSRLGGIAMTKIFLSHGIPHHMIDIISPRTDFNVTKFKKQAEIIIKDIFDLGKIPIICGGTGFWIQAIVDDVNFPEVKPDWRLRKKLEKYSAEKLFAMLKKLDPARAKIIDQKNKVRLIRAVEICKAIKKVPPLACHSERSRLGGRVEESMCGDNGYPFANARRSLGGVYPALGWARDDKRKYSFLQIGVKLSQEKLYASIKKRLQQRFAQGMIAEVKKLHKQSLSWKKIQSFGLGYFWIPLYLQKIVESEDELFEKIFQAEKNYAKRQMTWFKRDKRIRWLENYKEIEKSTKYFLK